MAEGLALTARAVEYGDDGLADWALGTPRDSRDRLAELTRTRRASRRVVRHYLRWRSQRVPAGREADNASHLELLASCLLLARTARTAPAQQRAALAAGIRELAIIVNDLARAPGDWDIRQRAVERVLALAARQKPEEETMRAQQVTDPLAYHGEGPVWSTRWGGLRWVDMLAGDVLCLTADERVTRTHVGTVAAALRPRQGQGAVIGVERGFALEDPDGSIRTLHSVWSDESVRMNEGACDPDGRFYCGSMAYDQRVGAAALYRLDPDLSLHVVLRDVTVSNGLDWSADGSLAYYNDTATHRTDVFDYDPARGLTNRRPFVDLAVEGLRPDGLTVDVEGGVWVALSNGGAVRRYTSEGRLDVVVDLPTRKVTACTFGGAALDQLFVTTSREGLEPGEDPLAGALFRADSGVSGQPVREFAG